MPLIGRWFVGRVDQAFVARRQIMSGRHRFVTGQPGLATVICVATCALCVARPAFAVKPSSPEVKQLVEKGLEFLETANEGRFGGRCLVAMTMLKAGRPVTHAKVQAAIEECQQKAKGEVTAVGEDIYSLGIATLFLCELDTSIYAHEIEFFLQALQERQKPHGGWGYPNDPPGDTSMTQYGVLSAWTARQAGFTVPDEVIEKVANWLIRTQDPSGAWGYKGNDPGSFEKVAQSEVRLSLTTAALGSTLIAANLLGVIDLADEGSEELPPALLPVEEEKLASSNANKTVDPARLRAAVSEGTGWFRKNYEISPGGFTHYYLYALERFMSFKELADSRRTDEVAWYNDGYQYLAKSQNKDGHWESSGGPAVDTAFAILFLLRSTKKAIEKTQTFGDGTLVGGRGLPKNTANVKLRGGRLVAKNQAQAVDDMLKALGDPDDSELDFMADNPDEIELSGDEKERLGQLKQLRQAVRGGAPKARLAAVKALGQSRDVQYVPLLIYALTDPDPQVAVAADRALRFMSRKLDIAAMKTSPDKSSRDAAVARWKDWYMKIYPDMALED
jgi:hypothetical protein